MPIELRKGDEVINRDGQVLRVVSVEEGYWIILKPLGGGDKIMVGLKEFQTLYVKRERERELNLSDAKTKPLTHGAGQ